MESLIFAVYRGRLEELRCSSLSLLQGGDCGLRWGIEDWVAECQSRIDCSSVGSSE